MQTIKKNWVYIFLTVAIAFFVYKKLVVPKQKIQLKTFKTDAGWGYDILKDDKIFIHQQFIPAIEGYKGFKNKDEAEKVGEITIERIKKGKGGGLPQITLEELDSLHITR